MTKRILFLCTGNSCRSQMAEGLARHYAPADWVIESAGIEAHGLNPMAVEVMREVGIDISAHTSKTISYDELSSFDVIITVCGHAEEVCPITPPGIVRLHWPIEDPARAQGSHEEIVKVFRKVRDDLEERVRGFLNLGRQRPTI